MHEVSASGFDELHPPFGPRDMLEVADPDHAGVARLRAAAAALDDRAITDALEAAADARRLGLPAELVPYRAVVHGIALVLQGEPEAAARELADAWSSHPDFAALPAALGVARLAAGDPEGAAQSMYAAIVSDDPDQSLEIHRRRLTLLLGEVRRREAR